MMLKEGTGNDMPCLWFHQCNYWNFRCRLFLSYSWFWQFLLIYRDSIGNWLSGTRWEKTTSFKLEMNIFPQAPCCLQAEETPRQAPKIFFFSNKATPFAFGPRLVVFSTLPPQVCSTYVHEVLGAKFSEAATTEWESERTVTMGRHWNMLPA